MLRWSGVLVTIGLMSGCTSVTVNRVDTGGRPLKIVCIENNPKVLVEDFVPVVEAGFRRHGIASALHAPPVPSACEFVLTYTATRGWDFVPYLKYAELRLRDRERTIGFASYRHRGGFGFSKWAGTASKMTPVIDQLLADY